jgi:glucose/arabinose dehydrogenase
LLLFASILTAQPAIRWEKLLTKLRQPTHATAARDGSNRLFIVEQEGIVKILAAGELLPTPFLDIKSKVQYGAELGLLSITFPPNFAEKQYFYAYYIDKDKSVTISRFHLSEDPNVADPDTESVILSIPQPFGQHNGGMVAFSPIDGMMYIATGDGGFEIKPGDEFIPDPLNSAQRTDTLLGKILRIDTESGVEPYAIPASNPKVEGARPEIWATGLRNPWRFSFDRATGDLFIGDVGNAFREEINYEPAGTPGGRNYGWSAREGSGCAPEFDCPDVPNLTPPLYEYAHEEGCSVTGGVVYRGSKYPSLQGIYLFGDFCNSMIWGLRQTEEGWKQYAFGTPEGLLVSFAEDEDGEVYIVDYDGNLLRLTVPEPEPIAIIEEPSTARVQPRIPRRAKK